MTFLNLNILSYLIILSIGVAPESKIAKEAGINVNKRNAIIVADNIAGRDSKYKGTLG